MTVTGLVNKHRLSVLQLNLYISTKLKSSDHQCIRFSFQKTEASVREHRYSRATNWDFYKETLAKRRHVKGTEEMAALIHGAIVESYKETQLS